MRQVKRSNRMFAYSERCGHDAAIAIVGEGKIYHFEKERFTGKRHDDGSITEFRDACMANAGVSWDDIEIVVGSSVFTAHWPVWHRCHGSNGWTGSTIDIDEILDGGEITIGDTVTNQPIGRTKMCHISHHFSHACYAFLTSPFNYSASLTMDGGGDGCVIPETGKTIVSGASVGFFGQPYNTSKCFFHIKHPRFSGCTVGSGWAGASLDLTGRNCQEGTVMALIGSKECHVLKPGFIALQEETNDLFVRYAKNLGCDTLVVGGGCALNGVATYNLLKRGYIKNLFVPPSVNDGGLVVGDALFAYHHVCGHPRNHYSPGTVAFSGWDAGVEVMSPRTGDVVAELITRGKTVGVFQGRAESGPRALGHRSILADPTNGNMRNKINQIKGRQPYRPVAPAMTPEFAQRYFHLVDEHAYYFMTCICEAKPEAVKLIPAGLHDDNTARVQILVPEAGLDPVMDGLILRNRPPCVLNTSFNGPGQSIVHTPETAKQTAKKLGLDICVIGNSIETLQS